MLERLREQSTSYPVVLLSGDDVDGQADVAAAVAAQAHSILVKTGRQAQQLESLVESYLQTNHQAVRPEIVDNLSVAVERIISNRTK